MAAQTPESIAFGDQMEADLPKQYKEKNAASGNTKQHKRDASNIDIVPDGDRVMEKQSVAFADDFELSDERATATTTSAAREQGSETLTAAKTEAEVDGTAKPTPSTVPQSLPSARPRRTRHTREPTPESDFKPGTSASEDDWDEKGRKPKAKPKARGQTKSRGQPKSRGRKTAVKVEKKAARGTVGGHKQEMTSKAVSTAISDSGVAPHEASFLEWNKIRSAHGASLAGGASLTVEQKQQQQAALEVMLSQFAAAELTAVETSRARAEEAEVKAEAEAEAEAEVDVENDGDVKMEVEKGAEEESDIDEKSKAE